MVQRRVPLLFGLGIACAIAACGDDVTNLTEITQIQPVDSGVPRGSIIALTRTGVIFWVNPAAPDVVLGARVIAGSNPADTLVTLAYRPANQQLYARADGGRLYMVHAPSGVATQVGTGSTVLGSSTAWTASFSPAADVMRVTTNARMNFRFNPVTGEGTPDDSLAYAGSITGIAYSPLSQSATTLYGLDGTNKQLVRIGGIGGVPSPNTGIVTVVGPYTLPTPNPAFGSFAIASGGQAYAAFFITPENVTRLYTLNLTTGVATPIGPLGSGSLLRAIAVVP